MIFNHSNHNNEGFILFPLILCIFLIFAASISLLFLKCHFRKTVLEQKRLDQCVQNTSITLLKIQNGIEASNLRMKAARIAAKSPVPYLKQAAQIDLALEFSFQESLLFLWTKHQMNWVLKKGCHSQNDLFYPINSLKWVRDPPDLDGPKPLNWTGTFPEHFKIFLSNGKQVSYAEIEGKNQMPKVVWKADWQQWTRIN